jgi:hypothetical protein
MITAIASTAIHNIKASCPLNWLSEFLYLPEVLYLVILTWLFFQDPDGSVLIIWFCRRSGCNLAPRGAVLGVRESARVVLSNQRRAIPQVYLPASARVQGFRHLADATRVAWQMAV